MIRKVYDLSDGWIFILHTGKQDFRWKDERPVWENENGRKVDLPHDWAITSPFDRDMEEGESQGFRSHFGIGWYCRDVELAEKKEGRCYLLDFGGVYENSTVWVNGVEAGGQKYGYSSFTLDVTEFVHTGFNRIEIKVDNTQRPSDRWYSGAGIYRSVKIIEAEEVRFDPMEVVVHTEISGKTVSLTVDSGIKERQVRAELLEGFSDAGGNGRKNAAAESGGLKAAAEGSSECVELRVENARLWSAETPYLYELRLSLLEGERVADQISFPVGLRRIELSLGHGMLVNGESVKIKGVCLHQDVGCMGTAAKKEIFRQRLLALKEMGCNAIRPAHHAFSSEFLDLCDELGFYVYEECFDKWHGGLYGRYFQTEWEKDMDAMVKRDRNRPCIFMWGVGNEVENQGQDSMLDTLRLLTEHVRALDQRPVSCAMNPHFKREDKTDLARVKDIQQFVDEVSDTEIYDNEERVERIMRIAEYVDVLACNYQEQWYPLIHERIPDKLILGTEVYQYFMGDFNQMQNFTDTNPVLTVKKMDYVIGSFIWTGIDYLGESMGYPAKGWGGSLIRTNGNRRFGYYLMQSYWNKKPMVYFSVMDYSLEDEGVKEHWDTPMLADHWHFPQFHKTVIPYVIASNCEEVQLYLNGKRIYIHRPAECNNHLITGFLPYHPGKVEAIGFESGKEVCRHILKTPGMAVKLGFMGDAWCQSGQGDPEPNRRDHKESFEETEGKDRIIRLPAQRGYQAQLSVRVFDGEGNPCFRESAKVRFRAEGPAKILAVDAGEITGNEPYQADMIHLFRGQASVVVELTGESGKVCVYADGEGMVSGCQVIYVEEK